MSNRLLESALSTESSDEALDETIMTATLEDAEAALAVEEASQESELAVLTAEELIHAASSLEKIQDSIEESERGLSTESAQAYSLAVNGLFGDAIPNPVASLESFGADSTRMEATEHSLEGIGETLKKVWESIKAAIKKAIEAISKFFTQLFGSIKKAKKKNDEVLSALKKKESDGAAAKEKEIKLTSATSIAKKDGSVDFNDSCKEIQNFYEADVGFMVNGVLAYYEYLGDDVIESLTEEAMEEARKMESELKWYETITPIKKKVEEAKKPSIDDLPGQAKVTPVLIDAFTGEGSKTQETTIGHTVTSVDDAKDPNETIKTPSIDDAIEAAECVNEILDAIAKGKETRDEIIKKRKEVQESVEKKVDEISKSLEKDDKGGKKGTKLIQKIMKDIMKKSAKNLTSSIQKADNHCYRYARAMTKNLEKVAAAYGGTEVSTT